MTRKHGNTKRYILIGLAMVTLILSSIACDDSDDVTNVNVGDDTANEIVDDVLETSDDINDSTFMKLWNATSFDDADDDNAE